MKRLISLFLTILMSISFSVTVFADYTDAPGYDPEKDDQLSSFQIGSSDGKEINRAEETIWYMRVVNGIRQIRQWSLTYGYWLTDWIDVGPAY